VPPDAVTVIDPSQLPKHLTFVVVDTTLTEDGCVINTDCVVIQLVAVLVTATLYKPAINPFTVDTLPVLTENTAGVHVNVFDPVPLTVTVAPPLLPPKQVTD
jgi:hypothetical protein